MLNGILGSLSRTVRNVPVAQHGFTLGPSAHLRPLATLAGLGTIFSNSGIVRFVQGGVVKTFRWTSQINRIVRPQTTLVLATRLSHDWSPCPLGSDVRREFDARGCWWRYRRR